MLAFPSALPHRLQELPPQQARLCLDTLRFMQRDLGLHLAGGRLLAGFSGGADSTALLLVLYYLAPKLGLTLTAAHLDHGLRASSAEEAEACAIFCRHLGIPCIIERVRENFHESGADAGLEERARTLRYEFYHRNMLVSRSAWTALGHQGNDLAEDVLMRLIRGTGWPGLGGMPGIDMKRRLFRPLLLSTRAALERFLSTLGVTWTEDPSNHEPRFFRNRIRKKILPLFLQENPSFLRTAAHLWQMARIDENYFSTMLPDAEPVVDSRHPSGILRISRSSLTSLPKALRLRLYKSVLTRLGPGQPGVEGLLALDRAWEQGRYHTEHVFPGGKKAIIAKEALYWKRDG